MPNISKIKLLNGDTFDLKDSNAVNSVSESKGVVTIVKQDGTSSNFNVVTDSQINALAPKNSPNFTGIPTAPTAAQGTNTTQIATTAFVMEALGINDAMVFKGTIGSSGATITTLPETHLQGWTYKVITAGTYAGKACEVGDMIICVVSATSTSNNDWTVVQANIDGAVTGPAGSTNSHIATFNGTSGKVIKDSGFTIGKSVPSDAVFTDHIYESKTAASGGTAESLVTTGEKYIWNNKSSFDGAYSSLSGKPTLGTAAAKDVAASGDASSTQVVMGNDTRLSDARPASDVSSWAKASSKPSYTKSEIGLSNVGNFKAVSTVANQGLTDTEKANARTNIGAGTSSFSGSYNDLSNKPTLFSGSYTDLSNKPTLGTASSKDVASSGNASSTQVVMGNDSRLSDSRPASDVSSWAKASTKPTYTASEVGLGNVGNFKAVSTVANQGLSSTEQSNARSNIGAGTSSFSGSYNDLSNKPTLFSGSYNDLSNKPTLGTAAAKNVPSSGNASTTQVVMGNDSRLTNSRPASDVYSWAKASTKPTYTASEVGLGNVGNFKAVSTVANQGLTETEKANARSNIGAGASSFSGSYNDLSNKPTLGTASSKDVASSGNASTSQVVMGNDTRLSDSRNAKDVYSWAKASSKPSYTASEVGAIATSAKGAASGVAELDSNGKVPSSQLPSYVDDVLEYNGTSSFPTTGETGKIYVDTSTNKTYRWGGSSYVEISPSLALGETSSTAYRGDRGKTAYDHSQKTSGNPHNVTKSDVGLGNVGNFKAVSTVASQGLSSTEQSNARANIGAGTSSFSGSYNDLSNKPTIPSKTSQLTNDSGFITTDTNTHRPIQVNGTEVLGNNTTALNLKAGSNVSISNSSGTVTIAATDTNTWRPVGTGASDAAAGNHTHSTSIATSSGTNQLTLAANTKYAITAGGTSYVFTTPPDTNTWRGISDAVNSTSSDVSASSKAVKTAYDLAASKTSNTGTVTSVATGVGLTGGTITGSGTIKAKLKSETARTIDALSVDTSTSKLYPVVADKSGYLAVGVPWTDNDHITTATTSGSGNAVTAISADANGALTVTKGTTFLTSHQDISGKADKSATVSTVSWDSTNKKLTKTINGTTSDIVTGATILGGLTKSQVTTALGYTPPTTDTKNTAGSTDTSSKIFLIGATSQAANPQTYSQDTAYVGTDGCLYSGGSKVRTESTKYRLWYKNVPVSALTGSIIDLSDSDITSDYVVEGNTITWGDPSKITTNITWSTDTAGKFIVTGTCTAATTATFALVKPDKKTVN